jgi:ferredoxin
MKIIIDSQKCVGCGRCTEICHTVFQLSDQGKAEVKVNNELPECAKKASDECPTEAIHVEP